MSQEFSLVGVVHLPSLPGAPNYDGQPIEKIAQVAAEDAATLAEAGFTEVMIQDATDRPQRTTVGAATVAAMTRVGTEVASATSVPLGIVLGHNDGPSAVAVAAAIGARFVRVKLLTGASVGPEGVLQGCAVETYDMRSRLGSAVEIWADVHEATSIPLAGDLLWSARESVKFGGAHRLVVTRDSSVDDALADIATLRTGLDGGLGEVPMVVGGRVTAATVATVRESADGAIVGGAVRTGRGPHDRVDRDRARALAAASRCPRR